VDGTTYGVVESRRGRFREEDRLVLNGTAFHTRLEDGAVVVTSGLGGVFPRGVPIGLVNGLAEAEGGWRKSYWLKPLAEPGTATHVLVAVGSPEGAPTDLTPIFPTDSVRTEQEFVLEERARADSLRALADSLARAHELLAAYAGRDSARLAGLSRADSLARLRARPTGAGAPPAPAPPAPVATEPRAVGNAPIRAPTIRPAIRPADTTAAPRPRAPVDTIRLGPQDPAPPAEDTLQ